MLNLVADDHYFVGLLPIESARVYQSGIDIIPEVRLATGKKFVVDDADFFFASQIEGLAAVELRWHFPPFPL